jgi:uncharacterized membrane protein
MLFATFLILWTGLFVPKRRTIAFILACFGTRVDGLFPLSHSFAASLGLEGYMMIGIILMIEKKYQDTS